MKVKKYIGQTINGFKILDSYVVELPSGGKARRVLLECESCKRQFERNSGIDFNHIKCKCKCEYLKERKQKYHFIEWNGQKYTETDFCKMFDIKVSTFRNRIKQGLSVEDAIKKEFTKICPICDKEFKTFRLSSRYCSQTCLRRGTHGKGKYKESKITTCVICGNTFETIRDDAKTCSVECRRSRNSLIRNGRFNLLRELGQYDESVTLKNVFIKFNGVCQVCGESLELKGDFRSDNYPSIDHIIPISRAGSHTWDNVQLLCRLCNDKKGAKEVKK